MEPTRMIFPVKNDSTLSSNKMPIIPTGILDIIIFNTVSISFLLKLKTPFMILKMSTLKTYMILIAVAIWTSTVNIRFCDCSVLSIKDAISKCPLLLIGKNSVIPCTIDRINISIKGSLLEKFVNSLNIEKDRNFF